MPESPPKEAELRHKLRNVEQEKQALQGLLSRAADELDNHSEANCTAHATRRAEQTARMLRRAASC